MRKLYYSGTILTMEDSSEKAEILITDNNKIAYVGPDRPEYHLDCDEFIDLHGKCLMPAFIDAHSHFLSMAGSFLQVSLNEVATWEEFEDRIKVYIRQNQIPSGAWIQAVGYDQTLLPGGLHPSRSFLDRICPESPLIVQHISGHMGVLNSLAMKMLGLNCSEDGLLQETEFVECLKKVPAPDFATLLAACEKAQQIYASYGITTIQEGMMVKEMIPLYQGLLASNKLKLDVIAYADLKDADRIYSAFSNGTYEHFKIGGCKIFLDGSPQGGTAWMRSPYEGTDNYGISTMSNEDVLSAVEAAVAADRQLLAHCNGDAACGQYLNALESVSKQYPSLPKTRPVLIHAQLIGLDQLSAAKKVGAIISFFVSHVFHWGDIHIRKFGFKRASAISPAKSALKHEIPITFHTDTPVILPNLLEAVSCAVNRTTRDGIQLGIDESISVFEALKAITIGSAYQYFEEDKKGTLKAGKLADLVILDRCPLETPSKDLGSICIIETIKNGNTVFHI